ncbi:hypothetical protein HO505_05100 [Streptococcus suis]|nr:hypothetical protein [Streptococcus suis]
MNIEFFGPPGTGKTYITEKLTGISRQEQKDNSHKKSIRLLKNFSKYSPLSLFYRYKIKKVLSGKVLHYHYHDTSLEEMIDSIVLVATSYRLNLRPDGILDEGLVQRVVSMGINFQLSKNTILGLIELFSLPLSDVKVVFISMDKSKILRSIQERGRKESKMDYFEDDKLTNFVEQYIEVCQFIAESFHFETITRSDFSKFIEENKRK